MKGLCLPDYALANIELGEDMATILKRIQISNTEMLKPQNVLEGSSYSLGKVANRDFWEKSLQDLISHWNLLLLSAPLSFLVFLVTMALMSQATRATLISL